MKFVNSNFLHTPLLGDNFFLFGFFVGKAKKIVNSRLKIFLLGYKNEIVFFNLFWSFFLYKTAFYFLKKALSFYKRPVLLILCANSFYIQKDFKKIIKAQSGKKIFCFFKSSRWAGGELLNGLNSTLIFKNQRGYFFPNFIINLNALKTEAIALEAKKLKIPSIGFVNSDMNLIFDYNIPLGLENLKHPLFFQTVLEKLLITL